MLKLETAIADEPTPPVATRPRPVSLDHVVDACRRYPGEAAVFYTRLSVHEPVANLVVRVSVPEGLRLEDYGAELSPVAARAATELTTEATYVVWALPGELPAGTQLELRTAGRVGPVAWESELESQAVVTGAEADLWVAEVATVKVETRAAYLRHLPALYEQDSLLSRFLMLFESFWAPLERQIEQGHAYLDPRLTPTRFVPWLASWLDLSLDDNWPEARQRQLVRWAIALHRSRGTRWGLQKYLEIYTGQPAEITEFRAKNFALGADARLGPGLALGRSNAPHTFSVCLSLPPLEAESEVERARLEAIRRCTIEAIIEMQKPAHTVYTLNLKPFEPASPLETGPVAVSPVKQEIDELATIWFKLDELGGA